MKKNIFSALFILPFSTLTVAQPVIQWQQTFGGTDWDESKDIQQTRDGGYIVAGTASSDDGDVGETHGYDDFWVLKLDSAGALQWKKLYGGSDLDIMKAICQTTDGGFVAAGYTASNDGDVSGNHGDYDAWVVKLDSVGGIQWQKCLGGSGWEDAWDVRPTADGGYILAGRSGIPDGDVTVNHGSLDYWVVKLDSIGQIIWQKSLGGSFVDLAYSVAPTTDGGYIVAGETNSQDGDITGFHGSSDYWVVKLNFEGKIEWQKTFGGTNLDRANEIHQTRDGGYIVIGQSRSSNGDVTGSHGGYDSWAVKLNEAGAIEWQKAMGGTGEDSGRSIQQTMDGGFILTGQAQSNNGDVVGNDGGADVWVVKLSESGLFLWQKTYGGSLAELGFAIQQARDQGYVLSGIAWSNDGDVSGVQGKTDIWVVKLAPESTPTSIPQAHTLAIYPNPAQHGIFLDLPTGILTDIDELSLEVRITDITGRTVHQNNISSSEKINISALPNGFYLLTAATNTGTVYTGKFRKQE